MGSDVRDDDTTSAADGSDGPAAPRRDPDPSRPSAVVVPLAMGQTSSPRAGTPLAQPGDGGSGPGAGLNAPAAERGAFFLEEEGRYADDNFLLRPDPDRFGVVPEAQRRLCGEVYAIRNTLKLLEEHGIFKKTDRGYGEFIERVKQAARAGCVGPNVDTSLASSALGAIRADIVRRRGRPIAYRYLLRLALWALLGVALGLTLAAVAPATVAGYGWLVAGAMVGAWLSVAATRWEIAFDGIQEFLDMRYEPPVRMLFVALLSMVIGLFLHQRVLSFTVGEVSLATFTTDPFTAVMVGVIAGIGERALSLQVLARAKEVFTPASR